MCYNGSKGAMQMKKEFTLVDPYEHEIQVYLWEADTRQPKGVVLLIHGASEYCERYDHFAKYLNSMGLHVIGNDHLGHGKTSTDLSKVYFDASIGFHKVYEGVKTVRDYVEEHYPKVPVIMFAHSMGSLIGRYAMLYDYRRYDMAIFSGTGAFSPWSIFIGKIISSIIIRLKGDQYVSPWFNNVIMGSHIRDLQKKGLINRRIEWISQDPQIQRAFEEDEYCGMPFTIGAQRDILHFIPEIQDKKKIKSSASSAAIYFINGDTDPLGHYGEDIKKLYNHYHDAGYSNVKYSVLSNTRHEVINAMEREHHYKVITDWIFRNL